MAKFHKEVCSVEIEDGLKCQNIYEMTVWFKYMVKDETLYYHITYYDIKSLKKNGTQAYYMGRKKLAEYLGKVKPVGLIEKHRNDALVAINL